MNATSKPNIQTRTRRRARNLREILANCELFAKIASKINGHTQNFASGDFQHLYPFFSEYFTSHFYTKTRNHSNAWKNGEFALPLLSVIFFHVYFTNSVSRMQFLKILCACSNDRTVFQSENKR